MLRTNYCDYNFSNANQDIIDRPKGTPEYLFLYFQTSMKIRLQGVMQTTRPGACLIIPPYTSTYYQAVDQFTNSFIHFYGEEADKIVSHYKNIPMEELFYLPDVNAVNAIVKDIFTEYMTKDFCYEEQIDMLLRKLLITISRQLGRSSQIPEASLDLYDSFQKARLQILVHPEQNWTAESMARLTNMASSQFYYYYKNFFKRSPKAELIDVRIERAQYLLMHETFCVADIAVYCGFSNLSHFTRYFKKKCNMTPGEYRKQSRITFKEILGKS